MAGLYLHVPFCAHRCHYCDFNTYAGLDDQIPRYVAALRADLRAVAAAGPRAVAPADAHLPAEWPAFTSLFVGGGTPTLLPSGDLAGILTLAREVLPFAADAEVTVEANPETVDAAAFEALLEAGFNRFSMGVQSLAPKVLEGLGRTHSAERGLQALDDAREAGFEDLNADLIYGSPWERPEDWVASLRGVLEAGPDHISAYSLTVEEGTPLHTLVATGRVPDVDPDVQADRHGAASDLLAAAGYGRYEVSNWARPGRASRHNVLYWSAGDHVGFGAGAHSHVGGSRWWDVRLPRDYTAAAMTGRSTVEGSENLEPDARAGEALMLGLRLVSGIDIEGFEARFGTAALQARSEEIRSLRSAGLVEETATHLRLTTDGTLLANEALCRLL